MCSPAGRGRIAKPGFWHRALALRIPRAAVWRAAFRQPCSARAAQRDRRDVIEHFQGTRSDTFPTCSPAYPAIARATPRRAGIIQPGRLANGRRAACSVRTATACPGARRTYGGAVRIDDAARLDHRPSAVGPPNAAATGRRLPFAGQFTDGQIVLPHPQGAAAHCRQFDQWRFPVSLAVFVALIALVCWFAVRAWHSGRCNLWRRPRKPSAATSATRPRHRRPEQKSARRRWPSTPCRNACANS